MKTTWVCPKRIYYFTLLGLQSIAYILVIFDLIEMRDWVYYGLILSCFITSAVLIRRDEQSYLLIGALYFTCVADYCLILGEASREVGVTFFFIVQLFYMARTLFLAKGKRERIINVFLRMILSVVAMVTIILVIGEKTEYLFVISTVYYLNLLLNILFTFLHFKGNELMAIGLVLFSLCDLTLGLREICKIFALPKDGWFYKALHPPFALEAIFYCPSQVLLSASAGRIFTKNEAGIVKK